MQFPYVKMGYIYFIGMLWNLNENVFMKMQFCGNRPYTYLVLIKRALMLFITILILWVNSSII